MSNPYTRKSNQSSEAAADDTREDVRQAPTLAEVPISAKSLNPAQQKRVRAALEELAKAHPNQTELAKLLGVKQQTVSRVLAEGTVGMKVALAVASARGQDLQALLSGAARARTYGKVEGWKAAVDAATAQGLVRRYVARALSTWPANLQVERIEPHLVADLAALWIKWTPLEVRAALETAEAAEDLVAQEAARAGEVKAEKSRRGRRTS